MSELIKNEELQLDLCLVVIIKETIKEKSVNKLEVKTDIFLENLLSDICYLGVELYS